VVVSRSLSTDHATHPVNACFHRWDGDLDLKYENRLYYIYTGFLLFFILIFYRHFILKVSHLLTQEDSACPRLQCLRISAQ